MKVFITGGTGNIGQYVTLALAERGHEAVVLSRSPEKHPSLAQKATLVKGDMANFELLPDIMQGCDAAIHIALGWGDEPVSMLTGDTMATAFLLEIAEKLGIARFIYTSSTAAMGHARPNMDESAANLPLDLYGATKAAGEAYVLGFTKYYGNGGSLAGGSLADGKVSMKRNIIRPGYTYSNPPFPGGSTQADARFRDIADAVARSKPITLIKNDGTQFISAPEIAQLYVKLLESDKNEQAYLALGTEFTTWERIAQMALECCPESKSEIVLNDLGWSGEPFMYNVSKMERDFGLSFDSRKDLKEHIRWNVGEAVGRLGSRE